MNSFRDFILISVLLTITVPDHGQVVTVSSLLSEMTDLKKLSELPDPWFRQAQASSYDRKSHAGGEDWFANYDVGQYVRKEVIEGRQEQVLADLTGPGTISRFWSANPDNTSPVRFYFDGEQKPGLVVPLNELFSGSHFLFGPEYSYISGTGGNLYFPIPYARSLKITIEDPKANLRLYYEIGYRTYDGNTKVETFNPAKTVSWQDQKIQTALRLTQPQGITPPKDAKWQSIALTIPAGESRRLPEITGENAVFSFSACLRNTRESSVWTDPNRAHVAWRHLILTISFDGQTCIRVPFGDFFGSGPGVNPYENLLFSVSPDGWMTSRLIMPFRQSMVIEIGNEGTVAYTSEFVTGTCPWKFTGGTCHLHAQWGTQTRESWPPFDMNFLNAKGQGKIIGTVYQVSNPSYIWWGEGDQKIFIDGEAFPSTFGTGTEDDYGYAYGYNGLFTRPYHAQTRVDGPASGGHISLNRWYILDALPYRKSIRFDQEVWHWMPCNPVWSHVIYWYARPGSAAPDPIDPQALMPMDLGIRENMLDLMEGEDLGYDPAPGSVSVERLANCSGARHLVWRNGQPGDRLTIKFQVPSDGNYQVMVNLCMSPDYGKHAFRINGTASEKVIDAWSEKLFWTRPVLGVFQLHKGENLMEITLMEPNSGAKPGNLFGLDYIFLVNLK